MKNTLKMEAVSSSSLPLNDCRLSTTQAIINRLHSLIHAALLLFLFRYRLSAILSGGAPVSLHILLLVSELILSFIWLIELAYKWSPVARVAYPERLPADGVALPGVDVFVCAADPNREPSLRVMNTVVSALALDYPPGKLRVYLSDDAGSGATRRASELAWEFAKVWVPFCRRHGVENRCPEAYFGDGNDTRSRHGNGEILAEEVQVRKGYEEFKTSLARMMEHMVMGNPVSNDHPAVIEVIGDGNKMGSNGEEDEMPWLFYVGREKRPSHHHHFKAGALNVLLRVSALITTSPYILVLDCDMYCNDPSSVRQAMCFHLDPNLSPSLAFVQYPQKYDNLSETDIYGAELREVWQKWEGMDGFMGPIMSGTGFFIKREALYGSRHIQEEADLIQLKECFGSSNEFIYKNQKLKDREVSLDDSWRKEIRLVASCDYEDDTKWGKEVGFRYFSVVEDYFTSLHIHCEGWTSVYVNPLRPCFLGLVPVSLGELMFQRMRWFSGLTQVGMSRFSPLLYGPLRMSMGQSMCYAGTAYSSLYFIPFYVLAVVPQIGLLKGIPLYPKVSSPYFFVFLFVFISSQLKHVHEVLSSRHSVTTWLNEQRTWMIYSVTSYLFANFDVIMEKLGLRAASFLPTSKTVDDEQEKRYQTGIYDFQAPAMFMVLLCSLYMLNVVTFGIGFGSLLCNGKGAEMLLQAFIPFFVTILHFPLFQGMALRKDSGRVSPHVSLISIVVVVTIMYMVSFFY